VKNNEINLFQKGRNILEILYWHTTAHSPILPLNNDHAQGSTRPRVLILHCHPHSRADTIPLLKSVSDTNSAFQEMGTHPSNPIRTSPNQDFQPTSPPHPNSLGKQAYFVIPSPLFSHEKNIYYLLSCQIPEVK
jgi:hypothetical protein